MARRLVSRLPSNRAAAPLNDIPFSFFKLSERLPSSRAAEPLNYIPLSFFKLSVRLPTSEKNTSKCGPVAVVLRGLYRSGLSSGWIQSRKHIRRVANYHRFLGVYAPKAGNAVKPTSMANWKQIASKGLWHIWLKCSIWLNFWSSYRNLWWKLRMTLFTNCRLTLGEWASTCKSTFGRPIDVHSQGSPISCTVSWWGRSSCSLTPTFLEFVLRSHDYASTGGVGHSSRDITRPIICRLNRSSGGHIFRCDWRVGWLLASFAHNEFRPPRFAQNENVWFGLVFIFPYDWGKVYSLFLMNLSCSRLSVVSSFKWNEYRSGRNEYWSGRKASKAKLTMGETRGYRRLSFLDRFLHLSWKSNEPFLGAARIMSGAAIDSVSSAGKQFLHQN